MVCFLLIHSQGKKNYLNAINGRGGQKLITCVQNVQQKNFQPTFSGQEMLLLHFSNFIQAVASTTEVLMIST